MRARPLVISLLAIGMFVLGAPAHAAVLDSQLDDSAQATRPPANYTWFGPVRTTGSNYLAVGYIPKDNLSITGVRFRVNASDAGNYVCPIGAILRYNGTSLPVTWDSGLTVGNIVPVATTTPDANGNCDYKTTDQYGRVSSVPVSPSYYYVFFIIVANGSTDGWVSMSGKPFASSTSQSFFGYRPSFSYYYTWGTSGLDAAYFEIFDTAPPPVIPPDPCAVPGACASNVLFLPGIEASRLYKPDYSGGTDKLWEPNADSDVQDLYMNPDGSSSRFDVYAKDVIDEKNVLPIGQGNIYKSFLNDLYKWKNTEHLIADYGIVPYDWRLSLDDILNYGNDIGGRIYYSGDLRATSTPYVIQELKRLAASSKTKKVTIVAHSNGGLAAKELTELLGPTESARLIDKIIFVAVPQVGTPQAVGAILHGYDQGLPFDWFPLVLTPETARTFAENMPSAYNLLPSANYFTQVDNPVVKFDNSDFLAEFRARYGSEIHDGAQLRNFITDARRLASSSPIDLLYPSVGNVALLSRAETFHNVADAWTPPSGVSLYEVAGWGEDTLATIEYYEGKKTYCSNPQDIYTCTDVPTIMYDPKEVVEGDGTVVVPSALWTPMTSTTVKYWVDLKKYNNDFPRSLLHLDQKHAEILEVPSLRTLIQNILTNATSTPLDFITTTQPATDAVADKRLRFVLHSPLNLSATDNLGNVISSATSTIPGSRWKRYGEVQILTVPKNTNLTLNLDGYATGSFTLDMQEIDGNNAITASSTLSLPFLLRRTPRQRWHLPTARSRMSRHFSWTTMGMARPTSRSNRRSAKKSSLTLCLPKRP